MPKEIKLIDLAAKLNMGFGSLKALIADKAIHDKPSPNTRVGLEIVETIFKALGAEVRRDVADGIRSDLIDAVTESSPKVGTKVEVKLESKEQFIETAVPKDLKPQFKILGKLETPGPKEETAKKKKESPKAEKQSVAKSKPQALPSEGEAPKAETKVDVKPVPAPEVEVSKSEIKQVVSKSELVAPKVEEVKEVGPKPILSEAKPVDQPEEDKKDDGIFRPSTASVNIQFKVVDKIDLSTINDSMRPAKKSRSELKEERKKRQRINKNAVDVKAEVAKVNASSKKNGQKSNGSNLNVSVQGKTANSQDTGKKKKKKAEVKPIVTDEDVQRQVKETLARLTSGKQSAAKGAKYRKEKRTAVRNAAEEARERDEQESRVLKLTEFVTVSDLANMMDVPVTQVIGTCMSLGLMVSINMRLDAETIDIVAEEFGFTTDFVSADVVESISQDEEEDREEDLVSRPPIVTVMGHVDHGKTSLLDRLRNSNVIDGEAGGITQHIGAYSLKLPSGKRITFLDTPGHEAFTAMRARGAKITDIAIIIVAADDDVMPQTKEAINHAAAAGVPIVFAINKIDRQGANPDRIREQLAAMNYLVEEWGGKYQCQEISAKQGINIDELLEKVLLEAELLELKANPKRKAVGSVIESSLDKGRGYVATVMVQNGTLSMGDVVLVGTHYGKVKAMFNERNQRLKMAGPSEPVLILGLDGAPTAGEIFNVMDSEQEARSIAGKREQLKREQDSRTKKGLTLDELARRRALGNFQELNVIIKGDVDGSVEALGDSLIRLSTEEIQVNVIHKGVGAISESDVVLAAASSAIIIGFQVRPSQAAKRQADREGVEIRTYSIIYDTIEDIKSAMEGMLSPEIKENVVANLEVQQTFKISKVGTIAGCMVIEGKIKRTNKIRLIRDGIVKYAGALGSLKRFKDDAKEVVMGQDCGLNIDGYNDIIVGDIIEAYEEVEIKKTLD
ncbi:MAG: translation initiation factor IF-2 [Porphyromonadaceae bacterium]|nr:translation initiation factor IF-2 [Porphyromonadaceae bacterium]